MARNKYPEQTLDQILTVSAQMFTQKGYEKTSIQDIINELGMSKGAVYHHFKSKEDILSAVMEKELGRAEEMFMELIQNTYAPNAKQKLISILENIVVDPGIQSNSMNQVLSTQIKNPQFVLGGIQKGVLKDARMIAELMEQGIEDGSISAAYPLECAEIFMLLVNIWVNPLLFGRDQAQTTERLRFLQHMMRLLGADIVSDELIQRIINRHASTGSYVDN